ncbi:MAG: hypothetical protein ABI315_07740 [Bacteroidia bacterium]
MNDITQDKIVNRTPKIINNYLGLAFPTSALIGGYLFLALGLIGLLSGHLVGILVALVGGFVCFTYLGIEINIKNKTIRQYTSYFGFKKGATKDLTVFPFICIFKSNKIYTTNSRSNRSVSYSEKTFDIYLLNQTHKEKILIKIEKGEDKAIQKAKEIADDMGIKLVQYNPVVLSRKNKR